MALYGVDDGFDEDIEEEEEDLDSTTHSCTYPCGDSLPYDTEVFLLTVVVCSLQLGKIAFPPALDTDGDFLYEPCFFCFSCWEELEEEISTRTRDTPPVVDDYAILDCSVCKSGVRRDELAATIQIGEFIHPRRTPDSTLGSSFIPNSIEPTDHIICINCLNILSTDIVDNLWTHPVMQHNECAEGTVLRCWRHGCSATNDCPRDKEID